MRGSARGRERQRERGTARKETNEIRREGVKWQKRDRGRGYGLYLIGERHYKL